MLLRNLAFNLAGQFAPLVAAVFCIPYLIHGAGVERFGLLTIAWMVIGYFSVFDLGIGRALTRAVAARRAVGEEAAIPALASTGLVMMALLSAVGTLALCGTAHWLTADLLKVDPSLRQEAFRTFILLGLSLPAVILSTGFRGILEAYGRFDVVNIVRAPMGIWTFVGPLLVLPFSQRLDLLVIALVVGRVVTSLWFGLYAARTLPGGLSLRLFERRQARELLVAGGWMTVSNIVSPLMVYLDRFVIGSILGAAVVAYYTTPYEVVFKLNVVPEGIFGVIFPLMTATLVSRPGELSRLYTLSSSLMLAAMLPLTAFLVAFAPEILERWLGPLFSERSTAVMQILAAGLTLNALSKVSFNLLQAAGLARATAFCHLAQLPVYLAVLWWLTTNHGIEGAAAAWGLRMAMDLSLMTVLCVACMKLPGASALKTGAAALVALLGLWALVQTPSLGWRAVELTLIVAACWSMALGVLIRDGYGASLLSKLRSKVRRHAA